MNNIDLKFRTKELEDIETFIENENNYILNELTRYETEEIVNNLNNYLVLLSYLRTQVDKAYNNTNIFINKLMDGDNFISVYEKAEDRGDINFINYLNVLNKVNIYQYKIPYVNEENGDFYEDNRVNLEEGIDDYIFESLYSSRVYQSDNNKVGYIDLNRGLVSFFPLIDVDYKYARENLILYILEVYKIGFIKEFTEMGRVSTLEVFLDRVEFDSYLNNLAREIGVDIQLFDILNQRFYLHLIKEQFTYLTNDDFEKKDPLESYNRVQVDISSKELISLIYNIQSYSDYINKFRNSPLTVTVKEPEYVFIDVDDVVYNAMNLDNLEFRMYLYKLLTNIYYLPNYLEIFKLDNISKEDSFNNNFSYFYNMLPHRLFMYNSYTLRKLYVLLSKENIKLTNINDKSSLTEQYKRMQIIPIQTIRNLYVKGRENLFLGVVQLKLKYPNLVNYYLITDKGTKISTKDNPLTINSNNDLILGYASQLDGEVVGLQYRSTIIEI